MKSATLHYAASSQVKSYNEIMIKMIINHNNNNDDDDDKIELSLNFYCFFPSLDRARTLMSFF